jgi:serine phosphatase RsbU (regulator of sigma subunit)
MTRRIGLAALFVFFLLAPVIARDFYWENPQPVGSGDCRFPVSASNGARSVVLWQEVSSSGSDGGEIYLSCRVFDGSRWRESRRFAGPFPYAGDIPSITSVAVDGKNRVFVTAVSGIDSISIFLSDDDGASFREVRLKGESTSAISPRIFARPDGSALLFATRGSEDNFTLVYATSADGIAWSDFMPFKPASGKKRAFIPSYAYARSSDVVVFQAFQSNETTGRSSWQLFSTVSKDRGTSWSEPAPLTDFSEPGLDAASAAAKPENYHNQRASLLVAGDAVSLAWERARTGNERYAIYYAELDGAGLIRGKPERISTGDGFCNNPDMVLLDGSPAVTWFDNRSGVNHVYMALKEGFAWTETDLSQGSRDSVFARIVNAGGDLELYWQQERDKSSRRVVRLAPDRSVSPPTVNASSFTAGYASRADMVRVTIAMPDDSSGVAGYSYAWQSGSKPDVPQTIQHLPGETKIAVEATEDGHWFLGVRVQDYAGNWSAPAYVEYIRDTTPPESPTIADLPVDPSGALDSNTFTLSWAPPENDAIAGYAWRFEYVAPASFIPVLQAKAGDSARWADEAAIELPVPAPQSSAVSRNTSVSYTNRDNGIYALSVAAVDSVGNIGKPTVRYVFLNKYVAYTYVSYIDSSMDEAGVISLSIIGRGFADGGNVSEIYFDRDGKAPYDLTLSLKSRQFRVANDRLVSGLRLSDMEEGEFRVGLLHPARGLYFTKPLLSVTTSGTVKFGDFRHEFVPDWKVVQSENTFTMRPDSIFLWSVFAFAVLALAASIFGIASVAGDSVSIRQDVRALIAGEIMPSEKKKRSVALRKKGLGLRFKLAFFTTTLVISVVLIVSIPLGLRFSANQERVLAQGLEDRVNVLLESLASGAKAYLPSQNILELGFLPSQMSALSEASSATITGDSLDGSVAGTEFVWATNDPKILEYIDTKDVQYGKSKLSRPENSVIDARVQALDGQATTAVGSLSEGITTLTQEGIKLALKTDAASVSRRDEIQTITRQLEEKMNVELAKLSVAGMGSYPDYNPQELSRTVTNYVFFKPVLYRQGTGTRYVHGTVRVEISTESLLAQVSSDRRSLVQTTAYIALVAILIGIVGAFALASIIISPVRKLSAHVAMIRDTEDKEELEGKDLKLRSKDEIGLLGETINDMTHGLVKAAAASKDLTVGKEVQKMFIPLETDSMGRKLTCGSSHEKYADFFGYYEGAKGVSGDYFDYIKLDDRHFAIIKCDVAGKGVPAALIMVEVATLFLDYFKDWKYEKNGYGNMSYIVSRINDLIESRGFKGRFAAFTLCIFDSVSGDVHFCNAGDNLVHMYDSAARKMKVITLPETSAAGVFPSFMVDMKGGFRVVKQHLNPGDVLFLYTDGIEEAKRMFRNANLTIHVCAEPGLEKESPHGSHTVGQDNEEMGPERVNEIIESVFARKKYSLFKWHNHEADAEYEFDFSTCEGTIEEAILALVSVEKVFRMYRDPKATDFDRVQVDRKVDLFLNKHFRQYSLYCGNRKDHQEHAEYMYYTNVREDAQYDDLTILGIKKK